MNTQENRDWQRKLQELEAQINQASSPSTVQPQPGQPLRNLFKDSKSIQSLLNQVTNWFNGLSGTAKVVVISFAALVGFAVIKSVLQLVASLVSLAILGVVLYGVYKLFVADKASQ